MNEEKKWLYHISPSNNNLSILQHGVLPAHSRGKRKVTWWVEVTLLDWALAHISARWHTSVDNLTVFAALADMSRMRAWAIKGVWTCATPVYAKESRSAADAMASMYGKDEEGVER